jgi:hypothetical protein
VVSPTDSERLALAAAEGRLILTLRSWTDSRPVETEGALPSGLVGEPVAQAQPSAGGGSPQHVAYAGRHGKGGKQVPPPAAMPTPDAPKPDVVEILRGDRFEQRNFKRGEK